MVMPGAMVMSSVMCVLVTRRIGNIRVAQNDTQTPIHRGEHESGGNERPQTEHGEYERSRPVAGTSIS